MVSAKHEGAVKRLAEPLRPDHQRPVKPRNELGTIGTRDSCRDGLSLAVRRCQSQVLAARPEHVRTQNQSVRAPRALPRSAPGP